MFSTPQPEIDDTKASVLLAGVATDGPTNQVCKIRSYSELTTTFGSSTMEGAYLSLPNPETYNVYGIRVNGTHACADVLTDVLTIYSYNAGAKYNYKLSCRIIAGVLTLQDDINSKVNTYTLNKFSTINKLCEKINKDCMANIHNFVAVDKSLNNTSIDQLTTVNQPISLTGGYDYEYLDNVSDSQALFPTYITNIEYANKVITLTFNNPLKAIDASLFSYTGWAKISMVENESSTITITLDNNAYSGDVLEIQDGLRDSSANYLPSYRLEYQEGWHECKSLKQLFKTTYEDYLYNTEAKIIAVTGIYYGNSVDYISDLVDFCYKQNKMGYPMMGVISAYKKGTQDIEQYVTKLEYEATQHDFNYDNQDAGAYVNVIAGEAQVSNYGIQMTVTLEGMLAGLLSLVDKKTNITNQVISDGSLLYDFKEFSIRKRGYLNRLTKANINCPYVSIGRGVCLYTATTMAKNVFRNTKYTRVGQEIVTRIVKATSTDIGENLTAVSSLSLDTKIKEVLEAMVAEQYIQSSYDYTIGTYDLYDAIVNINFIPLGDIENLFVCVVV